MNPETRTCARLRASLGVMAWTLAVMMLVACGNDHGADNRGERPPSPVTVEEVAATSVDVTQDYAGRVRGAREVEVRARVGGILEERLYREGRLVDQGETLFRIDPQPYEARLEEALAQRESAEASLEEAERDWRRISRLHERGAVSEHDRDAALSAVALARASVSVAAAQVSRARLDLDYSLVEAPISGVTSLEAVPEGTLLESGTLLTTIVQLDPVHVRFAIPEDDAMIQRTARRARQAGADDEFLREARLRLPDGSRHDTAGEIDFTASTIDPATGTVMVRAVFANPDGVIIPGQFVRISVLLETLEGVFRVPETIISEGRDGPRLFVLEEGHARVRTVTLGPVIDGRRVILDGLGDGDRVIVNGHAGLQDGAPVAVDGGEGR